MDLKRLKLAKECIGIVNQLYDLAEVPTEKRQDINDKADKYLLDQVLRIGGVSVSLPSVDDAGIIAVEIAEINNEMTAQEQAFFIAGFSECIKYLEMQSN